ncbi:MAG: glycosyltransferase [Pirellula sp.]
MEDRNGWQRAMMAAKICDVTVLYCPTTSHEHLNRFVPPEMPFDALRMIAVEHDWLSKRLISIDATFYSGYRHWQRLAFSEAKRLHKLEPFDLAHFVTLCGFREPGYLWKLGIPHVWGPLGGTHYFPKKFLSMLNFSNRVREISRSVINYYQLYWCPRTHLAARRSALVIAATVGAKKSLESGFQVPVAIDLETGIDYPISPKRPPRDTNRPLRLLWAGRLRAWKGLPLLLHAIARLPKANQVQLRVLGVGVCDEEWKQLARKLKIDNYIEWIRWPTYRETLAHYEWADAFVFTSLRDTSGTGLLEALAAGCPIIGLNHQGAADIMSPECAIPVAVTNIQDTIQHVCHAIKRLVEDSDYWLRLSHGASERAVYYEWRHRGEWLEGIYNSVIGASHR